MGILQVKQGGGIKSGTASVIREIKAKVSRPPPKSMYLSEDRDLWPGSIIWQLVYRGLRSIRFDSSHDWKRLDPLFFQSSHVIRTEPLHLKEHLSLLRRKWLYEWGMAVLRNAQNPGLLARSLIFQIRIRGFSDGLGLSISEIGRFFRI